MLLGSEGNHAVFLPAVVAFMALVGLVAGLGPARRALRLQPIDILRED
jgi:ABC-type antimicrobial peptide transport system permease subunit